MARPMDQAHAPAASRSGDAYPLCARDLGSGALGRAPLANTSAIVKAVMESESYIVEKSGVPVAELRPFEPLPPARRMPNREAILS